MRRTGITCYRLRTNEETVTVVATLLAHGGPLRAIVVAFGSDERPVQGWQARAGARWQWVQAHLVERPRDAGEVQALFLGRQQVLTTAYAPHSRHLSTRCGWNRKVSKIRAPHSANGVDV